MTCKLCNQDISTGCRHHIVNDLNSDKNTSIICERCCYLYKRYSRDGLETLEEMLEDSGLLNCVNCGFTPFITYEVSEDTTKCSCKCDNCNTGWDIDLTLSGLHKPEKYARITGGVFNR